MKEKLEQALQGLEAASQYFPMIITVDELTSRRKEYPQKYQLSGPITLSLGLVDIHSRLKHLSQFLSIPFTFSDDAKQDIVKYLQLLQENADKSAGELEEMATTKVGLGMDGTQHNIKALIEGVLNDLIRSANSINKVFG